jgi:hypothetical protein
MLEMHTKLWAETLKGEHLEDLGVDGMTILKQIL